MFNWLRRCELLFPLAWLGLGIFLLYWQVFLLDYIAVPADLPFDVDPLFLRVKPDDFIQSNNPLLDNHYYEFYSWHRVAARAIRETGRLPLWNPYLFAGQPLLANAQSGLLYPPNLLLFLLSAETVSAARSMFNILFAGVWVYLLARVLGASRNGATLSAVAFAFSTVIMVGPWHAYASSLIWLPMTLWAGEKSLVSKRPYFWGAWAALGVGLGIIGGHPETSFFNLFVFCVYFLLRLLFLPGAIRDKIGSALPLGMAIGLGLMIGAVQWLPFGVFLKRSAIDTRGSFGMNDPLFYHSGWQLQLPTLITLWMPNFFGNPADYSYFWPFSSFNNYLEQAISFGLLPLALGLGAAIGLSRKRPVIAVLALLALFCLLLAMRFPGFETVSHLPIFDKVNITRLKWDFALFGSLLAGFGLDGLRTYFLSRRAENRRLAAVVVIVLALALLVWIVGLVVFIALPYLAPLPPDSFAYHWFSEILSLGQPRSLVTLLVPLAAYLLFALASYRPRWMAGLEMGMIAIVFAELIVLAWGYNTVLPPAYVNLHHRSVQLLHKDPTLYRIATSFPVFWANLGAIYDLQDVAGHDLPVDRNFADIYQAQGGERVHAQEWTPDVPLLDYLNVRYVFTHREQADPKYELVFSRDGYYVYRNSQAMPRAFLVRRVRVVEENDAAIDLMLRGAADPQVIDLSQEVILPAPLSPEQEQSLREAESLDGELPPVEISQYTNDRLTLQVEAPTAAVLVMSDVYNPGWCVLIDGKPAELYRANVAFRGVYVPAGMHTVEMIYRPWEVRLGAALSLIGLVLGGLVVWRNRRPNGARKYVYYLRSIFQLVFGFAPLSRILAMFIKPTSKGSHIVALRRWGLRFEVRSAMDVWSVKETFIDRFYEKYGCPVGEGWVVVDIGGGIGDFSIFAAQRHPANTVYAFEPFPGSFDLLVGNLKRNQIANVRAFQEAVWSGSGRLALDTSTGEPVQFISRELDGEGAPGKVTVPCTPLEEIFDRLGIRCCDLMKIDAEGAEYAILFTTPEAVLAKIRRIVMEYHDAITPHTHAELVELLRGKGYRVAAVENVVHPELGYLYAER